MKKLYFIIAAQLGSLVSAQTNHIPDFIKANDAKNWSAHSASDVPLNRLTQIQIQKRLKNYNFIRRSKWKIVYLLRILSVCYLI